MKKLIQVSAVLSLVFFFSVLTASAQRIVSQYKAEIPFDFNVGEKSHQAGNYTIRVVKYSMNTMALTIEDEQKNISQTMFVRGNGDISKDETRLVFARYGEQRFLSGVVMREMTLPIGKPQNLEKILKAQGQPERQNQKKDAAIALK